MDESTSNVTNFELLLQKQSMKIARGIYGSNKYTEIEAVKPKCIYTTKDVIDSVKTAVKAIQNADIVKCYPNNRKKLQNYKKSAFMSVNVLPLPVEEPKPVNINKFETQCVTDTQLIDVVDNAEAIMQIVTDRGMTQEFDTSFDVPADTDKLLNVKDTDDCINNVENVINIVNKVDATQSKEVIVHEIQTETEDLTVDVIKTDENAICSEAVKVHEGNDQEAGDEHTIDAEISNTQLLNEHMDIDTDLDCLGVVIEDTDRSLSPVLTSTIKKPSQHLVYNLADFENFEKLSASLLRIDDSNFSTESSPSQLLNPEYILDLNNEELPSSPILKSTNETRKHVPDGFEINDPNIEEYNNNKPSTSKDYQKATFPDTATNKSNVLKEYELFKDEILFSSDEEEDYIHKSIIELPMTCALETSFYSDRSDILDKTMFVGFQTASNKSIQINLDSFGKAKSVFNGVEKGGGDPVSLTELVEKCDSLVSVSKDDRDSGSNTVGDVKIVEVVVSDNFNTPKAEKNAIPDTVTSKTNKLQSVNEKPHQITKKIDDNVNIEEDGNKLPGFKTASNKNIHLSEKALENVKNVFKDIDFDVNYLDEKEKTGDQTELNALNRQMSFEGFKTASNKNIIISQTSLERSKTIIKDINKAEKLNTVDGNTKDGETMIVEIETEEPVFKGFATASNKQIIISEEALQKSKSLFKNIDIIEQFAVDNEEDLFLDDFNEELNNVLDDAESKNSTELGKIASNLNETTRILDSKREETVISEQSLRYKTSFQNNDTLNEQNIKVPKGLLPESDPSLFKGFQTANNKNIPISKKALALGKKIFNDINTYNGDKLNEVLEDEPESDAKRCTTSCKESFEATRELVTYTERNQDIKDVDFEMPFTENEPVFHGFKSYDVNEVVDATKFFTGFRKANNKKIDISEVALLKSKHVFKEFELDAQASNVTENTRFENSKDKQRLSKLTLEKVAKIFQDIDIDLGPEVEKEIAYKETLVLKNNILPIINNEELSTADTSSNKNKVQDFIGFQTANNKKVEVSKEALAKTKKIFQDIEFSQNMDTVENKNTGFVGFQTANNKKVEVSKEALAKTKNIFQDIEFSQNMDTLENKNTGFVGFQTANNKKVEVSKEALAKTKNIFQDIEFSQNMDTLENKNTGFVGFQTANNKKVEVSEESLAKTKKIFQNIEFSQNMESIENKNTGFVGFQTANNKKVEVSKEALAKTKIIFQDIEFSQKVDVFENKTTTYAGFQTVNNKKVDISEEVLAKTKNIFQDIKFNQKDNKTFVGFQTASNRKVKISEEALAKTKNIFQDIELNEKKEASQNKNSSFVGFKTASNKKVEVSKEALAKTKNIFQEMEFSQNVFTSDIVKSKLVSEEAVHETEKENIKDIVNDKPKNTFVGFQTANKKTVVITEDALAKTRQVFQDIELCQKLPSNSTKIKIDVSVRFHNKNKKINDFTSKDTDKPRLGKIASNGAFKTKSTSEFTEVKAPKITKKEELDVQSYLNTQFLNNFDESMNTEDFIQIPKVIKRSGSPILSCPRAKKRKPFKTPYRLKAETEKPVTVLKTVTKTSNTFDFTENYKKTKLLKLEDIVMLENDATNEAKTDVYLSKFKFENLLEFEFENQRNDVTESKLTIEDVRNIFLNSVDKKIVPENWLDNHLKLILWKLLSYEIKFPKSMSNICNASVVMDQLKYRYDKELYRVERPALRKIFEKDDLSTRTLVLCVVSIIDDANVASVANPIKTIELQLTDGWYCITAYLDNMLTQLVRDKKITIGTKLVTCGAELVNCEQGISPWEDTSKVRLKLYGNSTRRAHWLSRLGYRGAAILSQLSTVRVDGGKVSKMRVFVTRIYPTLYVERFEDGSTVTRSERLEQIYQMKHETDRQMLLEKIYEEIEKEYADQSPQTSCLTQSQSTQDHNTKVREKLLQDIQSRVQDRLAGYQSRNVVALKKIRVCGLGEKGVSHGMISIWRPNDAILELLQEGTWINVMNVVPTALRYSEIQISAGRQSSFNRAKSKEITKESAYTKNLARTCYSLKYLTENPCINNNYNEIDTVGLVFLIDPPSIDFEKESIRQQHFQNVFLTDAENNMICINFWGGIKKFGYENVIDTGQVISCANLQKRIGNTRKNIAQYRVTEFTYFTKTPKNANSRSMMDELVKKLNGIDRRKFCQDCVEMKNNFVIKYQKNAENISPYRMLNADINSSKNKVFIDSPLQNLNKKTVEDLNLTGLDFESTFKQRDTQDMSPEVLKRKQRAQAKIARLEMYGEPPPLSSIHIINKSKNATNSYKSPIISNKNIVRQNDYIESPKTTIQHSGDTNVARLQNKVLPKSPLPCINRNYPKRTSVNPVKLNFTNNSGYSEDNSKVDHFAEEFESSPPLSLD